MIYSFLTKKYFKYAELFLKSYKKHNGESELIYLVTVGLDYKDMLKLSNLYGKLVIKEYTVNLIKFRLNIDNDKDFDKYETQSIEGKKCILWKNCVADDIRIDLFKTSTIEFPDESHYTFMDIDLLFRGNVIDYINSRKHTYIRLRPTSKLYGKVAIGFIIFVNKTCQHLIDTWIKEINGVKLSERGVAHGQVAFYRMYCKEHLKYKIKDLPLKYLDKYMGDSSLVWSPNDGSKEDGYNIMFKDYTKERK